MIKAKLGLGLILAVSALAASAVPALAHEYSSTGPSSAEGKGHEFTVGTQTVKCAVAKFAWTQKGLSPTFNVAPKYETCTLDGASASVVVNSCTYTFGTPEETASEVFKGTVTVGPKGCTIVIKATILGLSCTVTVEGEQSGLKEVSIENNKPSGGGTIKADVSGIAFTSTGTGCKPVGIPASGTGEYKGTVEEKGVTITKP